MLCKWVQSSRCWRRKASAESQSVMAAEPWRSRQAKTAARSARARKAGRMSDRYAKASGGSVPQISRDGTSMSRAARDSARVSGDVSVTGRWALKRWGKGLFLSMPIMTESRERESAPASMS